MAAAEDEHPLLDEAPGNSWTLCGFNCQNWVGWRGLESNRTAYKSACSLCLIAIMSAVYFPKVGFVTPLGVTGSVFAAKLSIETWGQDTPTWACPGSLTLFFLVYALGLPGILWTFAYCTHADIELPYRDALGVVLFLFGSGYSLSYEMHRFWWKARPENKGKLHTIGLAALSIHPNYFGDFFAYTGWALVSGSYCTLSTVLWQPLCFLVMVIPNSDAYLAQRYPDEFPAYAANTATLFPFIFNRLVLLGLAWACFAAAIYFSTTCNAACGM